MYPNPVRAATYLATWAHQDAQHESQATAATELEQVLELADQDFAACETDEQRQAVWSVIAAANRRFMARNNGSNAALELMRALENRSYGFRGPSPLDADSPKIQQRSIDEDFDRARILVALKTHPHRTRQIFDNAHRITGMGRREIRKFQDNVRQERNKAPAFHRNYTDVKQRVDSGELTLIEDLLK